MKTSRRHFFRFAGLGAMLQRSRTKHKSRPAPCPVDFRGIPIYCSDAIINTEPVVIG